MKIYNSLSKKKEEFKPINSPNVGLYACGPTVYHYAHIGNFRTYIMTDVLVRTLNYLGYKTTYVMNITDVGHLVGDGDEGEDKMEKGSRLQKKSVWDVAKYFTNAFLSDWKELNLVEPDERPKPTDHIQEQIDFVKRLETKGFTYKTSDGIYFDTSKLSDYGAMINLDHSSLKEGARVEKNLEKKNPTDFALWKFAKTNEKRQMEWSSPWGEHSFPGWSIECSAMSMKYLGDQFDIHTGGTDIKSVHHINEIAQSESLLGKKPWVKYWVHGEMIKVNGKKMSKSLGNMYNLSDIKERGFDPIALKYLYLTSHYRDFLNFTWEALGGAQKGLDNLRKLVLSAKEQTSRTILSEEKREKIVVFQNKFKEIISDDINTPKVLALVWEVVKSNIASNDKYELVVDFDKVLGLNLGKMSKRTKTPKISEKVKKILTLREKLRNEGKYDEADELREKLAKKGYIIRDVGNKSTVSKA